MLDLFYLLNEPFVSGFFINRRNRTEIIVQGVFEQITKRTDKHKYPQVPRGVFSQLVRDVT